MVAVDTKPLWSSLPLRPITMGSCDCWEHKVGAFLRRDGVLTYQVVLDKEGGCSWNLIELLWVFGQPDSNVPLCSQASLNLRSVKFWNKEDKIS